MSGRVYGHDETEDFETLAEAERQDDGTIMFRVVQIDKRQTNHVPGATEEGTR